MNPTNSNRVESSHLPEEPDSANRAESSERHPRDLSSIPNDIVKAQQMAAAGESYLMEIDKITHIYHHDEGLERARRYQSLLKAELGWINQFVPHGPTIGDHHEFVLREVVRD